MRRLWAWGAGLSFALACASHLMTLFYTPALVALLARFRWREGGALWRRQPPGDESAALLGPFGLFLVGLGLATVLASQAGRLWGLDNDTTRIVPLLATEDIRYFFTMVSLGHARFLGFIYVTGAPLAIPLIAGAVWRGGLGPAGAWLALACLCGVGWTTVWHPDFLWRDWDLFVNVAFPLNFLAGLLLARELAGRREIGSGAASAAQGEIALGEGARGGGVPGGIG